MEDLLTPVSTSYTTKRDEVGLVELRAPQKVPNHLSIAATPVEALEILKNEPDHDSLISALRCLRQDNLKFDIAAPSPLAAQLVHVLVSDIVPNYWSLIYERKKRNREPTKSKSSSELELLLSCLRSVMGLNALLLCVKQLIQQSQESKKAVGGPNIQDRLTSCLEALTELISRNDTVKRLSNAPSTSTAAQPKQKAIWNEILNIFGSGKILGLAAQAEEVIGGLSKKLPVRYWIADGRAYSSWLARNITYLAKELPQDSESGWKGCGELLCKALRFGHSGKWHIHNRHQTLTIWQR